MATLKDKAPSPYAYRTEYRNEVAVRIRPFKTDAPRDKGTAGTTATLRS